MSNYHRERAFKQYCANRDAQKVKLSDVLEVREDGSTKPVETLKVNHFF